MPECLTTEHLEQAKVDSLAAAAVAAAEADIGDNNDVEGEDEENDDGDVLQETIAQVLAEEFEWNEGIDDEEGEGGEEEDEEAETPEEAQKRVEELNSVGFCTGSHYQYTWDPHRNSLRQRQRPLRHAWTLFAATCLDPCSCDRESLASQSVA